MKHFEVTLSRVFIVTAENAKEAKEKGVRRLSESYNQTRIREDFLKTLSPSAEWIPPDSHQCPFCYSTHIEGGQIEISEKEAVQPMCCHNCNEDWDESFVMRGRYKKDGFIIYPTGKA